MQGYLIFVEARFIGIQVSCLKPGQLLLEVFDSDSLLLDDGLCVFEKNPSVNVLRAIDVTGLDGKDDGSFDLGRKIRVRE